ncbi:MAG: DEAD/DEAH box helicase [Cryomorphaceae bacterium]|nr:DEAD/DEAH box helicase [Flavobacteriales bacterium]
MKNGFEAFRITRQFIDALDAMGIDTPTEIQDKAIVPALAGQDVLGIAETGSGKTLAYLLPLAAKIKYAREGHPLAVVLAPSKELAVQIHRVWCSLAANTDMRAVCLYGGVGKKTQVAALEAGCEVVITTPGRLIDLYSFGHVFLRQVRTLVLDEADRMMEMGFMPQLRSILEIIPVKRQNLLFSATFPERMEHMAGEFLDFPVRVESAEHGKPVESVIQQWVPVPNFRTKLGFLRHVLDGGWERVMVFCRTRDAAERVSKYLERRRPGSVRVLHSNKGQHSRINALDAFREGEVQVLVTTDVSSRGIDIAGVSHVVNFEIPKTIEDYLHRIGRTARINTEGTAVSLANPAEAPEILAIAEALGADVVRTELPAAVEQAPDLPGERQEIARALDMMKRKADSTYKGAFHDKQKRPGGAKKRQSRSAKGGKSKGGKR